MVLILAGAQFWHIGCNFKKTGNFKACKALTQLNDYAAVDTQLVDEPIAVPLKTVFHYSTGSLSHFSNGGFPSMLSKLVPPTEHRAVVLAW